VDIQCYRPTEQVFRRIGAEIGPQKGRTGCWHIRRWIKNLAESRQRRLGRHRSARGPKISCVAQTFSPIGGVECFCSFEGHPTQYI